MLKTLVTAWLIVLVATTASASQLRHSETSIHRHLEAEEYMAQEAGLTASQCLIEHGFDFVGEDLTNVPGASAGACCGQCSAVSGCGAFTWTAFNNGTCWLKRGRGKVVVNANAQSALVLRSGRLACEPRYNIDIVGNDIGTAKSEGDGGCCDLCRAKLGCRAYSWADGTCYLKSGRGKSVVKLGVISADVYPATTFESSQFCAQEAGVDYVGNDVGSKPSATAGGCCSICQGFPGCGAYTWSNYNGGTCWLKSAKGDTVRKTGVTSAVAVQAPEIFVAFERDTDFVGYDIGNYRTISADVCAHKCFNFVNGCRAVTWTNYNGGTCWYKSQKSTTQAKAGALSYAFA